MTTPLGDQFRAIMPYLYVRDMARTLAFYTEKLGFRDPWTWGEPVTDGGCTNGVISLIFAQDPAQAERVNGEQHAEIILFVRSVDAVYQACIEREVPVLGPPRDEAWGVREFTAVDPDGYYLRISRGQGHDHDD